MTFTLRSAVLSLLCVFMCSWAFAASWPNTNAPKTSPGLPNHLPVSDARPLPTSLPKPFKAATPVVGNTVQWTGAVSTDWFTAGNWITSSGTPNIPPKGGSITGDHVIIPDVSGASGNFPVIVSDTARARSIVLQAGASLTVNLSATLNVVGSDADGFTNEGIFTNKGTVLVDSAYNDAFVNKLNAQIINEGQLELKNGMGNRLINYGSITNTSGTFTVNQGVDTAFINYASGNLINNATFKVQFGENVRLYNLGSIHNQSGTFTVEGALAGNGVVNGDAGSIINEAAFIIRGGKGAQLVNYASIENRSGSLTIDGGSFLDYIVHNLSQISNKTGATFIIRSGSGTGLLNDSTVVNDGTMTIESGGNDGDKPRLYNGLGDTIINKGTLTVRGGIYTTVENCGVIENHGSIDLGAGTFESGKQVKGITLHNKFKIYNKTGATFTFMTGTNDGIVNDSIFINDGSITCSGGGGNPSIKNSEGDTLISTGDISIMSVGDFVSDFGIAVLVNNGYFEFHKNLNINNTGNHCVFNAGVFLGKPGSKMKLERGNKTLFYNDVAGEVLLNGESEFSSNDRGAIANYGSFQQIGGVLKIPGNLGKKVVANYNYMEISGVPGLVILNLDTLFYNADTLLFSTTSANNIKNITSFIINEGYFLSQADYFLENMGWASNLISNAGIFIHDANYNIDAKKVAGARPFIENKAGSHFYQRGNVTVLESDQHAISNAGYYLLKGNLKATKMSFGGKAVVVNTDTLINEGIIEMDTLSQGIQNSAYFVNSLDGKIYVDFASKNGIDNTGDLYNFGEIWMAKDTGIGGTGIYNTDLFENCGLINIGQKGPVFGGGIVNDGAGVFNNLPGGYIVSAKVDSTAILNKGTSFTNSSCGLIEAATSIIDQSNSFVNNGVIVQAADVLVLDGNINTNNGTIHDLDPDNLVITTNTGQVLNTPYTTPAVPAISCAVNTTVAACQTQSQVNAAFATWLAGTTANGGTNGVLTNNSTGAPSACGGSTTVTFTYTSCAKEPTTCEATFTVPASPTVVLSCPTNTTVAACQSQAAVNTAFATWLASVSASGGCNGVLTNNNTGAPSACGGSTTVTFTYTSACAPTSTTCQATFTVASAPTVVLTCPVNTTLTTCQSQASINTAFATWLASATAGGGCNGVFTNNNTGAPSASGGSTTVTFTYTSDCAPLTTTCQATFTTPSVPTAGVTFSETSGAINNDGLICGGSSVTLTGTGGTSYAWSNGVNAAANPVTPASTTTYTVTVTNASGCSATTSAVVVVNPNITYYKDADADGYGSLAITTLSCAGAPPTFVTNSTDCNDNNNVVFPGAFETCGSTIDNNCDSNVGSVIVAPTLVSQAVTGGAVKLIWSGSCTFRYRIQVQKVGTSTWIYYYTNGSVSNLTLPNLAPGTYRWTVRAQSASNSGPYTNPMATPNTFVIPIVP